MRQTIKGFVIWWAFFKVVFRLMWQARGEKPNRAKVRRLIRNIDNEWGDIA